MYDSVSRTAKDHIQKLMADVFQNTLPDWYGLSDLKIIASVPSDVPLLQVHDRLLDRVFVTDNGELLHLEFQSQIENNLYRFRSPRPLFIAFLGFLFGLCIRVMPFGVTAILPLSSRYSNMTIRILWFACLGSVRFISGIAIMEFLEFL